MTRIALAALSATWVALGPGCADDPCADQVPGTVCAVAGTGELGFNHDGKPPLETDFFLPSRARRGPDGRLYVVDFNNWRIRRLGDDGLVHTYAGNGVHAAAFPGVPAIESPLDNPQDLDWLPDGRMVLVSPEDPRVLVFEDDVVHVLAGTGELGTTGAEGDGGDALRARFLALDGVVVAPDGAVYVSDHEANRIRVIRNGIIDTFAGTGEEGYGGDGGPALEATFNYPTGLALDGAGNLYVTDSLNHVVRRIGPDGVIDTVAGTGTQGLSGDGGPATAATFDEPYGVVVDRDGTLYVADRSNFRVRRIGPDGVIDTLAGTEEGYAGDGGAARDAHLGYLGRLTLDGRSLLVADQSNGCIRRIYLDPATP